MSGANSACDVLPYVEALKWPAVVLVLCLVVLWKLLPEIRAFVSRLKHFRFKGAEAAADQLAASTQAVGEASRPGGPHLFEISDNAYLRSVAKQVAHNVHGMQFKSNDERDRWLFREGASLAITVEFERLYRIIWASQMDLLAAANQPQGVSSSDVSRRYATVAGRAPAVYGKYSMEQWLGFMENTSLIYRDGNNWAATPKGTLFIQYLAGQHYDLRGMYHDR